MADWAKPSIIREQVMILYPTLEEMIADDHPVRLFEELLLHQDWREWEKSYALYRGQPPIHPRIIAGALLYGLAHRIRSSRDLEDACRNRLDFLWLVEGRTIDHSTFAKFRNRHEKGLEELFKGINRVARELGHIKLEEVATDGTRIKADSSRYETKTGAELEQWLGELEDRLTTALVEMGQTDDAEDGQYGESGSPHSLPSELRDLKRRRDLVQRAHEVVKEVEKNREDRHQFDPSKEAKMCWSDPDARILKNKEGGWSPNYTPVVSSDGGEGFIVSASVTNSTAEHPFWETALSDIEDTFCALPDYLLGDGAYTDLETVKRVESRDVIPLAPVESTGAVEGDAAWRPDPEDAVCEERLVDLPVNKKTQRFTRRAFIFDHASDCFYCPWGKRLSYRCLTTHRRGDRKRQTRVYKALKEDCRICPLRNHCIAHHHTVRRVERMVNSEVHDRMAKRMSSLANKERFARRKVIAESCFAHIKHNMGIRRFLHRGLSKVQLEWKWICTSYNLKKLIRLISKEREASFDILSCPALV